MEVASSLRSTRKQALQSKGQSPLCCATSCSGKGSRTSQVCFVDGKFDLCNSCKEMLVSPSVCTKFRCPDPAVCSDLQPMMVCSNLACQRSTHVACEKPEIASKAIKNDRYQYFCFECRATRVHMRKGKIFRPTYLTSEELRKLWPLPKKRAVESYRYAHAEFYKDINELLVDAKMEPLSFARDQAMKFLRFERKVMPSSSAPAKFLINDENEFEQVNDQNETVPSQNSKDIAKN